MRFPSGAIAIVPPSFATLMQLRIAWISVVCFLIGIGATRNLMRDETNPFEKISSGTPAVIAASECGFNEYSNFYRQYKKIFGISPSNTK